MKRMKRLAVAAVALYLTVSLALSVCISVGFLRWRIIPRRAPFLLVDVACSAVVSLDGERADGIDQHGEYIAFHGMTPGEHVLSILVYNPLTNWNDDIIARYDVAVWR